MSSTGSPLHFGGFEVNLTTGELHRKGRTVKLQPKPFKVLALLLERQGELVTREEIHQKVWGQAALADFEHVLNFVIKKIREALGDDADRPRYIETLPRRGYRFIAPVERAGTVVTERVSGQPPAIIPKNRVTAIAEGPTPSPKVAPLEGAGSAVLAVAAPFNLEVSPTGGTQCAWRSRDGTCAAPPDLEVSPTGGTAVPAVRDVASAITGETPLSRDQEEHGQELGLREAKDATARRPVQRWRFAAGRAAALIAVGVLAFLLRSTLPLPRITGSIQLTHDGLDKERMVTDGSRIYFSSYRRDTPSLYEVFAAGGETIPFETPVSSPFVFDISPARSELLVGSCDLAGSPSDCPLWILPVLGRSPRRLGNIFASDATWSPDGKHVDYVRGNNLYSVNTDGTESARIVSVAAGASISWPRWSPDGSRLRFSVATQSNGTSLWEVSADGTNLHPLLSGWNTPPGECCGSWTPDGRYFLFQSDRGGNRNIWAIREESSVFRKASRRPVQLTIGPTSATTAAPSTDGRRVFVVTARSGELVRYDSVSQQFEPYLSGISATGVNFSRDGKWVTYVAYPEHTLWRSRVDGSERLQLTFPPLYAIQPRWSPDGTRIAFMGLEPRQAWSVYVISADGGSLEQPVPGDHRGFDPNWSPDGNSLLFGRNPSDKIPGAGTLDLRLVDLRTHALSKVAGSEELWSPRWSRDGRYILAFPRAADRLMLFDVNSQTWTELAKIHVSWPEWSREGDYVYFTDESKGRSASGIFRVRIRDHKLEQVAGLGDFRQPRMDWGGWAGLAPDDSPLLLREAGTQDIYALDWNAP